MAAAAGHAQVPQPPRSSATGLDKAVRLSQIYYGNTPGSLRGPKALHEEARRQGQLDISLADSKRFLNTQPIYTLHKPVRRRFPTNPILAYIPGQIFQIDLMSMQRWASVNDGVPYIFVGIDTYSKLLACVPVENRKPVTVIRALGELVAGLPFPIRSIYCDKEGAFISKLMKRWLETHGMEMYTSASERKAPLAERIIRFLRRRLQRQFRLSGSRRWLSTISQIVSQYNDARHSTTGIRPLDLAVDPMIPTPASLLPAPGRSGDGGGHSNLPPVGSYVRLSTIKTLMEKEADTGWQHQQPLHYTWHALLCHTHTHTTYFCCYCRLDRGDIPRGRSQDVLAHTHDLCA